MATTTIPCWPRQTMVVLVASVLVSGCATPGQTQEKAAPKPHGAKPSPAHGQINLWRLADLAQAKEAVVLLRSPQGIHGAIETAMSRRILAATARIVEASGEGQSPEVMLVGSSGINAFAFFEGTQPSIGISLGMFRLLAADDDAWAALIGHEVAHLRLEHLRDMKDRRQKSELTSSVAAVVLSVIGLPFAGLATDTTTTLAERAYSRDDEREADRVGLDYMRKAGFAAEGAIRLQKLLLGADDRSGMPFLSTHPGGEERIENLRQLMHSGN